MIIDIIIGIALIVSVIIGIVRGFVKEIAVVVGLILGFYIASQKYLILEHYLFKSTATSTTYNVLSFIIIFVVVFFLVFLLGLLLQKVVHLIMLGWLDKILGGLFGFVKGIIIVWIMILLVTTILPNTKSVISKSALAVRIIELANNFTKIPTPVKKDKKDLTNLTNTYILISE